MAETRRVTITDIMQILHHKGRARVGEPMKMYKLRDFFKDYGPDYANDTECAVEGARELGLVTIDEESWHNDVTLTDDGNAWTPDDELPEIRYVYLVNGEMSLGTLNDWAKLWRDSHYSAIDISPHLRTWNGPEGGHKVAVDRLGLTENDYIKYCISAAGEQLYITVDGRA